MATNTNDLEKALQRLNLSTSLKKQPAEFSLFPELPIELRIKIWEASFAPRRIVIKKRHSNRPREARLNITIGALLLVNKESRQIFLENYTLSFYEYGLPGIYINYSLDVLFLNGNIKILRLLTRQYPSAMRRVQRLEIRNCSQMRKSSFGDTDLSAMPSLKSFAVRWHPRLESSYRKCLEYQAPSMVVDMITNAKSALNRSNLYTSRCIPRLSAIVSREDIYVKTPAERQGLAEMVDHFVIREASESEWKTFETDVPAEWRITYPEKSHAFDIGWFPCELKRSSFVLKPKEKGICQKCFAPKFEWGHSLEYTLDCVKFWT